VEAILHGIRLGLIIFFLVGPVFILLMEETIHRGTKTATLLASGFWLSDFSFAIIAYFGISTFVEGKEVNYDWGYLAVLIFLIAGVSAIKSRHDFQLKTKIELSNIGNIFLKGLLVNTFNPFVIMFWLAVATQVDYGSSLNNSLFYGSLFFIIVFGDLIKIYLAHKFSLKLSVKNLSIARALGGCLLIILALVMAFRIYMN